MILIDGSYLYELGQIVQPLHEITDKTTNFDCWFKSLNAQNKLTEFSTRSVFVNELKLTVQAASDLSTKLGAFTKNPDVENVHQVIDWNQWFPILDSLKTFETILKAELKNGNTFLATAKGGYDLRKMILHGETLFPNSLKDKVPEVLSDIQQATKCMAFELYTAAGFHLHRANEAVILKYYDILTQGKPRPTGRNMGKYIGALEKEGAPKNITSCLRDLKDMHRNPLMHPDQSIENLDDSIALLNSIYTAMAAMLKEIT